MDESGGLRDLRRLRLVGVLAPVIFLLGFEAFRMAVLRPMLEGGAENLVAAIVGGCAAAAFGWVIFLNIDRAQRSIVRRNRDLAIVTAVSIATHDELDVERLLHAGLRVILDSTGAEEARVVLHPGDAGGSDREVTLRPDRSHETDALDGPDRVLDIPLTAGAMPIGNLHLVVAARQASELPSPEALSMVGRQLAAAIQIGQLIGDLHRRRDEGHTFYETLLGISNRAPLPEVLRTILGGARGHLQADEGWVCLTRAVIHDLEADRDRLTAMGDGMDCGEPGPETPSGTVQRDHHCPIGRSADLAATLQVPVWSSDEHVGDLWLGRRTGAAFTERDRRYLVSLAGLTAIAIGAARAREREHQVAVLAERDRIARELHDSLAQVLGSTHLRLRAQLARQEVIERPRIAAELAELADITEDAYRDVREAILGLREASRPRGLLGSLEAYLGKYSHQSGINTVLETTLEGEPDLPTKAEIQVIRVIQEALTNVRKHARATSAKVRVSASPGGDSLTIVIEDDGRGFEQAEVTIHRDGGFGLQTMRERMDLAGGSVRIDSAPGRGTKVIAILPVTPRANGTATNDAAMLPDHR